MFNKKLHIKKLNINNFDVKNKGKDSECFSINNKI